MKKKTNPTTNELAQMLVSSLFNPKTIDESAETLEEIGLKIGLSAETVRRKMQPRLASGEVEQVWKQGRDRLTPAYRVVKPTVKPDPHGFKRAGLGRAK